ncbi:lysylphosphatidylglycerol synthase transmembrane domain-containing protein [Marinicrinis lubricantis]|uniref:Phosphatidylglycerol lysyltransferase n=1 Tax=Marinicrinis lubricantis TaxID=2086470 RepID=A0ABW1IKV7_9BACL
MKLKGKKFWLFAVNSLLLVVAFYFLFTHMNMKLSDIWRFLLNANRWFYLSLIVFTIFLVMQAWNWVQILNHPGRLIAQTRGLLIYINSQFAKYIPGGVWNYVGRVYMTSQAGVAIPHQMLTLFYENVLLVLAAAVYAVYLLYLLNMLTLTGLILSAAAFVLFYIFYTPLTGWTEKQLRRFKKFKNLQLSLPRKSFFTFLGYFLVSHFIMGLAYWMLLKSFGLQDVSLFYAAGTFALAWLVGLMSPLPGGIGVREGFLIYLLQFQVPLDLATQISIITRIWNIISELLFFILMNGFALLKKGWKQI